MSRAMTCAECGASAVVLNGDDRCAGCTARDLRVAVIPHPGYELFLRTFPQTDRSYPTGGGCDAWLVPLADGGHVLLTTPDNPQQPEPADTHVDVGSYDADGTWREESQADALDSLTWAEAIERVRRHIDTAVEAAAAAQGFGLVPCLTRGEALELIENAAPSLTELQDISREWIGHAQEGTPKVELAELLREYVSESALTDDVRSNGPQDSDPTGIIA